MGMVTFYQKAQYTEARYLFGPVPENTEDYAGAKIQLEKLKPILYKDSVSDSIIQSIRDERNIGNSDSGYQNK
jgi:hypothetical protein